MRTRFEEQMLKLNTEMIAMGSMIERAIESAGALLMTRDKEAAAALRDGDDEVDRKEREIETLCLRIILMQQPVARDLRIISAALKMITDMERIADQASDIAEILTMPVEGALMPMPGHLPAMAEETARMVHRAVDAYVARDVELARQVKKDDDIVDDLFDQVKADLMEQFNSFTKLGITPSGMQLLDMLMIAKYFERSADHAVNIAEWVEFAVTGVYKGDRLS
ncbi:MAG TPA: phosphate signaling complex protein PhoU [Candidatus Limnocylindria bacterium]|nr:phosphate signaling complex protein PhoU [Candidatus Limnocylindria bacterium]